MEARGTYALATIIVRYGKCYNRPMEQPLPKKGRPFLPPERRRTEQAALRLNDAERRRLQWLSGHLQILRYADILRVALEVLEEQEKKKMQP